MKALTLTQPWASLMAIGAKRIETRSWSTPYRGEIVIHAAKNFPRWAREFAAEPTVSKLFEPGYEFPLSRGLCIVRLLGCFPTSEVGLRQLSFVAGGKPSAKELEFGDFGYGRYAWLTEYVRPLLPITDPIRGSLGLWDWSGEL